MTRIIAGSARGRRIAVPAQGTRPTSDRVREACFAALDAMLLREGRTWSELHVVDLFAGSGALGFEAASRGAASVLLVERARPALKVLRQNAAALALAACRIESADALTWSPVPGSPIDVLLADPPYDLPDAAVRGLIVSLRPRLAPGFIVVVERRRGDACPLPQEWEITERRYGDTVLWYGREEA